MNFDRAFELLIGNEGALSLDPTDRGNWTGGKVGKGELKGSKYGISAASYPSLDIKNISLTLAKAIYKQDYWDIAKLDQLPDEIRFHVFDTAVNSGVSTAVKLLQKAVGAKPDGLLGAKTLAAALTTRDLATKYNAHRLLFMADLSAWSTQGKGWARRIAHNMLIE